MPAPQRQTNASSSSRSKTFQALSLILILLAATVYYKEIQQFSSLSLVENSLSPEKNVACDPNVIYRGPAGLPPLKTRPQIGKLLEARKLTDGAEVGVQKGYFSHQTLNDWKSCKSFKLIDLWGYQENYKDFANVNNEEHEKRFQETKTRMEPFKEKGVDIQYFRMYSTEAAKKIPDLSLDYVYVDARHDYCGVFEDLLAYYPKLRPGGILAGHDLLDNFELKKIDGYQDWSLCMDGSVKPRSVKGAVIDFATQMGLVVSPMYQDGNFASWYLQKPTRLECVQWDLQPNASFSLD